MEITYKKNYVGNFTLYELYGIIIIRKVNLMGYLKTKGGKTMGKNTQWYNSAFFTEEDINIMKNVTEEDNFPVLHFKEYKGKENRFWKVISVATIFIKILWNGLKRKFLI